MNRESKTSVNEQGWTISNTFPSLYPPPHVESSPCNTVVVLIIRGGNKLLEASQCVSLGTVAGPYLFIPSLRLSHQLTIIPGCMGPMIQQLPGSVMALVLCLIVIWLKHKLQFVQSRFRLTRFFSLQQLYAALQIKRLFIQPVMSFTWTIYT